VNLFVAARGGQPVSFLAADGADWEAYVRLTEVGQADLTVVAKYDRVPGRPLVCPVRTGRPPGCPQPTGCS
jgi:hypothetical protein